MGDMSLKFATMIGSRICHDLISPLGAINNGMELLAMDGMTTSPEMALISDSVDAANARIRLFRIAYGAQDTTQNIARHDVMSILTQVLSSKRIALNWCPSGDLPRSEIQIAFLALQCCELALAYGGALSFDRSDRQWRITATGERLSYDPALWRLLSGDDAPTETTLPAHIQFLLLPILAAELNRQIEVRVTDQSLSLMI